MPTWRQEEVVRGKITSVVNSTGTVKPVKSVQIGAFVSGPIDPETELVEFNQDVKKGEVLAIIDQRIYESDVARDLAAVKAAEASEKASLRLCTKTSCEWPMRITSPGFSGQSSLRR